MNYHEKDLCLAITQTDKGWEWVCNTNCVILAKPLNLKVRVMKKIQSEGNDIFLIKHEDSWFI